MPNVLSILLMMFVSLMERVENFSTFRKYNSIIRVGKSFQQLQSSPTSWLPKQPAPRWRLPQPLKLVSLKVSPFHLLQRCKFLEGQRPRFSQRRVRQILISRHQHRSSRFRLSSFKGLVEWPFEKEAGEDVRWRIPTTNAALTLLTANFWSGDKKRSEHW